MRKNDNGLQAKWLIYGANGYTGRLIAEAAHARGWKPVLGGRNRLEVEKLAAKLELDFVSFGLEDPQALAKSIAPFTLVLHCAGPFSKTAKPMFQACLAAGTHYLDITGEIAVFERILSKTKEAHAAGIIAIPGVGFDVVPSDCLAKALAEKCASPVSLELLLLPSGGFSPGTMKTMAEGFFRGTVVRSENRIRMLDTFVSGERIYAGQAIPCLGIAWGDISSAWYSTKIPNISVFLRASKSSVQRLRALSLLRPILALPLVQKLLQALIKKFLSGPSAAERANTPYRIWGLVVDSDGKRIERGIETPNGYTFTVDAALASVEKILRSPPAAGAHSPAMAFGSEFAISLPKTRWLERFPKRTK